MERGTLKYLWLGFALIFAPAQAEVFYSYTDHLGSGGLRTDPTGEVQQITQYLPFGETLYEQHSTLNDSRFTYTGQELDRESDLYDYGARYYDPILARFTSVDPGWDSLNRYEYARNNPMSYTDPNGQSPLLVVYAFVKAAEVTVGTLALINDMAHYERAIKNNDLKEAVLYSLLIGLDVAMIDPFIPPGPGTATAVARFSGHDAATLVLSNPQVVEEAAERFGARGVAELAGYLGISYSEDATSGGEPTIPSDGWTLENYGKPISEELGDDFFPSNLATSQPTVAKDRVRMFMRMIQGKIPGTTFDPNRYPVNVTQTPNRQLIVDENLELVIALRKLGRSLKGNVRLVRALPVETITSPLLGGGEIPSTVVRPVVPWNEVKWDISKWNSF